MEAKELTMKVGDKAEIVANDSWHQFKIGETVEISYLYPNANPPFYDCRNELREVWSVRESDLAPLTNH